MMSNNNTRNIYKTVESGADDDEMEMLLNSPTASHQIIGNNIMTTINIENDMEPGTSHQHVERLQHLQQTRREVDTTRINMETIPNPPNENGGVNENIDDRQVMPNLFAMLREARHQFSRSQSLIDHHPPANAGNTRSRSWRENLYEVLSSPASPRSHTNVLRAIFTPSSNVHYDTTHTNVLYPDDQFHFMLNIQNNSQTEREAQSSGRIQSASALRLSRQSSRLADEITLNENTTSDPRTSAIDITTESTSDVSSNTRRQSITANSSTNNPRQPQRQASITGSTSTPTVDMIDDADTNAVGEIIVKVVTHFIRYLPFIFIVFVKFIHDHLLGILDILVLQSVVYQLNKTIKEQAAKHNQKSYAILVRDFILAVCIVIYRFTLSTSTPDPFGLLINPPGSNIQLNLFSSENTVPMKEVFSDVEINSFANEVPSAVTNSFSSTVSITKVLSLGILLYYVAVNDLILKLITQLIKLIVTLFPTKVIRHKSRARLYALIENISQVYRALVPIRQWLRYLFDSYSGFEVISGILFSSFYMGAKLFQLFERGRPLKTAIVNFMLNMDFNRKPTKDELEAAGIVCPICHDAYSTPVVLECGHIFCDECVNTWFKREQTCPMCRAKVSEDPAWQDGATTYFYQLC